MINKILKKIAENSSEAAKVRIKMKALGFEWCSTVGPCETYHKDIGDGKSMYVVCENETEVPETFNEMYGVTIFEDKGDTVAWVNGAIVKIAEIEKIRSAEK